MCLYKREAESGEFLWETGFEPRRKFSANCRVESI